MRSWLLVCALALAACDSPATRSTSDLAAPASDDMTSSSSCATSCAPACASGLTCVVDTGSVSPFSATCLAPCTSGVDCSGGRVCVAIVGVAGRFCLATDEPVTCGAQCDLTPMVSFCSGSEVASTYRGVVCGAKYVHCANGCVEDAPDGGTDRHARCS